VWVNIAEPERGHGSIDHSLVAMALASDGTAVVDAATDPDGWLTLASSGPLAGHFPSPVGPVPSVDFAPIFSEAAGGVFVVGGHDPGTMEPTRQIEFWPVGGAEWRRTLVPDYAPENVLAATFSFADLRLWIVDWRWDGSAREFRVTRVDPVFSTAQTVLRGEYHDVLPHIAVDLQGHVVLFASRLDGFDAVRFRLDSSDGYTIERLEGNETVVKRTPIFHRRGITFVTAAPDERLQIIERTRLRQVCCDGTACGVPTACEHEQVAPLF